MSRITKLFLGVKSNTIGVLTFRDFEKLLRAFGFVELRQRGSHRCFRHPECNELLVIQPRGADAKPYQVRAFLDIVEVNGLELK